MRKIGISILIAFLMIISLGNVNSVFAKEAVDVTLHYVNSDNNEQIALDYNIRVFPGTSFTHESPEIDGYELDDANNKTITDIATKNETINVSYHPKVVNYKVVCQLQSDKKIFTDFQTDTYTAKANTTQKVFTPTFDGYTLDTVDTNLYISSNGDSVKYLKYLKTKQVTSLYFSTGGGTTINPLVGKEGATLTPPSNPTKEGYTFDGWLVDGVDTTIPTTFPDLDMIFKAKWIANDVNYKVNYYQEKVGSNGEYTLKSTTTCTGKSGSKTAVASKITCGLEDDYKYYTYSHEDEPKEINGDGSTVINVYYDCANVSVTESYVDDNGNNQKVKTFTGKYGNIYDFVSFKDVLDDYHSKGGTKQYIASPGWLVDSTNKQTLELNSDVVSVVDGKLVVNYTTQLSDKKTINYYERYYEEQLDGSYKQAYTLACTFLTTGVTENITTTPTGYIYKDYRLADQIYDGNDDSTLTYSAWDTSPAFGFGDANLADIRLNRTSNNITYINGSTTIATKSYKYGQNFDLNSDVDVSSLTPLSTGYEFDGWYLDNGTKLTSTDTMGTSDITVHAKWKKPDIKIVFDGDNGNPKTETTGESGSKVKEPTAPIKEGCTFLGWYYLDPVSKLYTRYNFDAPVETNVTLVAKYDPPQTVIEYTVYYTYNGGEKVPIGTDQAGEGTYITVVAPDYKMLGIENLAFPDKLSHSLALDSTNNEIVFNYYSQPQYTYTINYLDTNGNKLKDSYTFTSMYAYLSYEESIPGYYLKENDTLSEYNQTINLVYSKDTSIVINNKANPTTNTVNGLNIHTGDNTSILVSLIGLIITAKILISYKIKENK
ncbi:MAG: InlB B-repeat-containing protein [Thomasclavelia sp.]|nr:InlB B-repeat-containing protein [Thomasclavelia sp.]